MERLTERDEYGNADIIALSDVMPEIYAGLSFAETNALTDALNRLAEYEDTGLTPKEVASIKETWDMFGGEIGIQHTHMELDKYKETGLTPEDCAAVNKADSTREYINFKRAEAEGRLVVLPCKVGDTVYRVEKGRCGDERACDTICTYMVRNVCPYYCGKDEIVESAFSLVDYPYIGKTIFLTREEAEVAMKKEGE